MIDHSGMGITNYDINKVFYSKALSPLGIVLIAKVQGLKSFAAK
jgi:hypothetical protein